MLPNKGASKEGWLWVNDRKKNISKLFSCGTKRLLTTKERSSSTNSVLPVDITGSMRSGYSEGLNALLNPKLENEEDLRFISETSSSNRLNKFGSLPTSLAQNVYIAAAKWTFIESWPNTDQYFPLLKTKKYLHRPLRILDRNISILWELVNRNFQKERVKEVGCLLGPPIYNWGMLKESKISGCMRVQHIRIKLKHFQESENKG